MNYLPTKEADWTSSDAVRLREFLESSTGQRAIAHVTDDAPVLLDGSDVNKTLVASGEVKGFNKALRSLFLLTIEKPPAPAERKDPYPDIDDDKHWDDNPVIKPAPTKPSTT